MLAGHIPPRPRTYSTRLAVIGLAVTIGFSVICGVTLTDMGKRDYELARRSAANVVATISADIARNLELYDLSLQAAVDGMKLPEISQVPPAIRQMILFDRAATAKHLGSIRVLDQNGIAILDSRVLEAEAIDHSKRDYFQVHVQNAGLGSYVSKPWVSNHGEYLIGISRRMSDTDGSFLGVVVGTLRLSYFHSLFKNVDLHEGDALTLTHASGVMLMRIPFDIDLIGRDMSNAELFGQMVSPASSSFEALAGIDHVKRLYVHQPIGTRPLMLNYGLWVDGIYEGWRQEAWRVGAMILLLCGTNLALILFLARALKRGAMAKHELAVTATTDGLTGLCNRRRFDEIFDQEWRRAQRAQLPLAVLMIDVDQFKSYNDRFGHQAGDAALAAIASCIAQATRRSGDLAARYGGEEFVVLLPGKTPEQAYEVAEHIRANVIALRAQQLARPDSTPTISLGVASMIPQQGLQLTDLLKAADNALYEAKNKGRNRTELSLELHPGAVPENKLAAA